MGPEGPGIAHRLAIGHVAECHNPTSQVRNWLGGHVRSFITTRTIEEDARAREVPLRRRLPLHTRTVLGMEKPGSYGQRLDGSAKSLLLELHGTVVAVGTVKVGARPFRRMLRNKGDHVGDFPPRQASAMHAGVDRQVPDPTAARVPRANRRRLAQDRR